MTKSRSLLMVAAVAVALTGGAALAAGHEHGHDAGGGSAVSRLTLNKGKKWVTDEQLRGGMAAIRDETQAAVEPIHAGKYTPEQYAALAGRIEKQITDVIARCKLPPEVDAQIHLVLADFFTGTDAMKKEGDRKQGVVTVIEALQAYPKYFEHPGWKPIKH